MSKPAIVSLSITTIVVLAALLVVAVMNGAPHAPSRYPTKFPGIYWSPGA